MVTLANFLDIFSLVSSVDPSSTTTTSTFLYLCVWIELKHTSVNFHLFLTGMTTNTFIFFSPKLQPSFLPSSERQAICFQSKNFLLITAIPSPVYHQCFFVRPSYYLSKSSKSPVLPAWSQLRVF